VEKDGGLYDKGSMESVSSMLKWVRKPPAAFNMHTSAYRLFG
jgi:hypothetical protein